MIRKVTSPAGDTTTSFGYTTNVATLPASTQSPFSLKDGEANTIEAVVPASGRTVIEDDPGTLYLLNTTSVANSLGSIDIEAGALRVQNDSNLGPTPSTLTIRSGARTTTMQFTLYVVGRTAAESL